MLNKLILAGIGAGGEDQQTSPISIFHLPFLAFVVVIMFVGTLLCALTDTISILLFNTVCFLPEASEQVCQILGF